MTYPSRLGQIGYQLEDGTRLTQSQFNELGNRRDTRYASGMLAITLS
jgi:hypothetical protein